MALLSTNTAQLFRNLNLNRMTKLSSFMVKLEYEKCETYSRDVECGC